MAEEFYFQWQNSFLRDTIYPRREVKLIDFLVYYKEIELWSEYKDRDIRAKIEEYHNRKKLAVENAVKAYYEHRYYFLKEDVSAEYRQKFATLDKAAMEKINALHKTFQTYLGKFKDPRSETYFVSQHVLYWQQVCKDFKARVASKQRRVFIMKSQVPPRPRRSPLRPGARARLVAGERLTLVVGLYWGQGVRNRLTGRQKAVARSKQDLGLRSKP